MAQLIIPNRLKDTLGAIEGFGQTYGNLRQLRLQNDRQGKLDAQSKLESDQRLAAGALGIESEKADQARKMELRALESQLGQADAGQVMGPSQAGDFQAGLKDEWAPLKDRISAKIFTMQGQPTVSGDLKAKREDKAIADMRLQTKAQQDAEMHASNLETAKVNRERGNFQLGGTSDGNFTVLDTRKGNLTNTGVKKDAPIPKAGQDPAFDALPTEQKEQVKILAQSMGKRQLAVNELEAGLKEFQAAKTDNDKQRIGRGMLKVLNSPENPDAIGAEEEKGIGNALRFQKFNVLGPGQFVGTDFPGFETQVQAKIDIMKAAAEKNSKNIDTIYGRVSPTTGGGQSQQSDDMLTQAQTILGDKEATPAEKKAAQDYINRRQAQVR